MSNTILAQNPEIDTDPIRLTKNKNAKMHLTALRLLAFIVGIIVQLILLYHIFTWLGGYMHLVYGGLVLLQIGFAIYFINSNMNATAKITWLMLFCVAPVAGVFLYFIAISDRDHRRIKVRLTSLKKQTIDCVPDETELLEKIKKENMSLYNLANYLKAEGHFNIYKNNEVTYFPLGENKFVAMLEELKKAKKFIFMEYFIIEEGMMWGNILEILIEKARQGVEVRVMYDGTCEFSKLPSNYANLLKEQGIKAKVFFELSPVLSTAYNYRDHRKILVIDGKVAFNGGVNLADEYINAKEKVFGLDKEDVHWKDTALMVKGPAVASYTMMFLQMWNLEKKKGVPSDENDIDDFIKWTYPSVVYPDATGYVMPYGSDPIDGEHVGEMVYMDIINHASNYFYMSTPYLILDGEMEKALILAAKRGVDVRLILPHVPDKKYAFALALTHYKALLTAGVRIYEYTPGFIHAKTLVCDNHKAVVGTINLDYRSLYHHFECATYLYRVPEILAIKNDITHTLQVSQEMGLTTTNQGPVDYKKGRFGLILVGKVLKVIAPLL